MNQVEQVRGDISKMIDMGAPMSDVDSYVEAHGLTANDFGPSTTEKVVQGVADLGNAERVGLGKLGTGIIQYGAEKIGNKDLIDSTKRVATDLENQSINNKKSSPVLGTIGEIAPQIGAVSGLGFSLPALALGSAALQFLSPEANQEDVQPYEGTAFERALKPVGEATSSLVQLAGIDPNSRAGRGAQGAIMGAGSYGLGKGGSTLVKYGNQGAKATVRGLTKIDQDAIKTLQDSGIDPTLHLTSNSHVLKSVSNSMQKLPLIGNRLERQSGDAVNQLESNVNNTAGNLGTASDAIEGGAALQRGLKQFETQTGDMIDRNYATADNLIPGETPADTTNLQNLSKNYQTKTNQTPLSKAVSEPEINKVTNAALESTGAKQVSTGLVDANGAAITRAEQPSVPYSTMKNVRSKVGEKSRRIDAPSEYKQLYGALSEDMSATAKGISPDAAQAASRANNYYRAVMQRSEKLARFFNKNQDGTFVMAPEKVAAATRQELQLLKKSIPKADFDNYTSSVVRKMGEAPAGAQNATGEVFSPNTFLTNYSKLSQSGKADVMFNKQTAIELNRAAKVADRFRLLSKTDNAGNTTNSAIAAGALYNLLVRPVASVTLGVPAYGFERLLTSPKMLKVINDYAYRPVVKNAKIGGEFSAKLYQAAGQDIDSQNEAKKYIEALKRGGQVNLYNDQGKVP